MHTGESQPKQLHFAINYERLYSILTQKNLRAVSYETATSPIP
jgi:hypothetical protein